MNRYALDPPDDDAYELQPNATCEDCGVAYAKADADPTTWCDACSDRRDRWGHGTGGADDAHGGAGGGPGESARCRMIPKCLSPEIVPVVDVEIVPYTVNGISPVVDVALVPTPMQLQLPTLAELQATPRALRKDQLPTKLGRAIASRAFRLEDQRQLRKWAAAVKARDRWRDRKTGLRVRRCLELDPRRAEAHHVVSKDDWAVRYDVRNGITLSLATHDAVERGQLAIEGTVFFLVAGTRYIDATFPVTFVRR